MGRPYRKGPIPYFHKVNDVPPFDGAEHFKGLYMSSLAHTDDRFYTEGRACGSIQGIGLSEVASFDFPNVLAKKDFIEDAETGEEVIESRSLWFCSSSSCCSSASSTCDDRALCSRS